MEDNRKKIVLVNENQTNLYIGRTILKDHYSVYPIASAAMVFEILEKITPDMILLGIEMREMNGLEILKTLKKDVRFSDIPVVFLTSTNDEVIKNEGQRLGAVDYIDIACSPDVLIERIENQLQKSTV
jgi:putative two-component system response regulator